MPISKDSAVQHLDRVIEEIKTGDCIIVGATLSVNDGWVEENRVGEAVERSASTVEKRFTVVWRVPREGS